MVALLSATASNSEPFAVNYDGLVKLLGFNVHNSTLLLWERQGRFPKRFRLPASPRALWKCSEIEEYLRLSAEARALAPVPNTSAASAALARKRARLRRGA